MNKKAVTFATILTATISGSTFAQENAAMRPAESDFKFSLGVVSSVQSELFYGDEGSTRTGIFPIAALEYKSAYLKGSELGYKFDLSENATVSAFVAFNGIGLVGAPSGFSENAIDADDLDRGYRGINDRENQAVAGLRFDYEITDSMSIELDGCGGERGSSAGAKLEHTFSGEKSKWAVSPFIAARVMDSDFVDYYFSVSNNEAAHADSYKIAHVYDSDDWGYANSIGISAMYRIGKNVALISKVEAQKVSSGITDSPLVQKDENVAFSLGAIYKF